MIKLHFTAGIGIVPRVIRYITWSETNHVAIEIDGVVYQSSHDTGVTKEPLAKWRAKKEGQYVASYVINGMDSTVVKRRLDREVGKGYDWLNIFCYPFRCDYQIPERWTCSELIAWVLRELIPHSYYHRVAPRHLMLLGHVAERSVL